LFQRENVGLGMFCGMEYLSKLNESGGVQIENGIGNDPGRLSLISSTGQQYYGNVALSSCPKYDLIALNDTLNGNEN